MARSKIQSKSVNLSDDYSFSGNLNVPVKTANPSTTSSGAIYYNSAEAQFRMHNGSSWVTVKGFKDGSSAALAPNSASDLADIGIRTSGIYWINLPIVGVQQVYCDMVTDGGGWMMLAYAGSTSGVGDSNHMVYNTIGTLGTSRTYGQTSFSRFDIARAMSSIGATSSSQLMWRRTNDSNKILIHSADEMWNRMPGGSSAGNRDMNGSGSGYPITTMKMSRTGVNGIVSKTNGRYESGASYPGIAWNSSYNDNTDNVGSFDTYLNRRQIAYWETNGPQSQSQWFHGSVLSLGDGSGPTYSQSRLDVEIYFRVRTPT